MACDLREQIVGVEGTVGKEQHVRSQIRYQLLRVVRFTPGHRSEGCRDEAASAGLAQCHQHQSGVSGFAEAAGGAAEPGPVPFMAGDDQAAAAVKGDCSPASVTHPGSGRLGQRPCQHLEQSPDRGGADPSAQVTKCFLGGFSDRPCQPRDELCPHKSGAEMLEQSQSQNEIHSDSGGQTPQPAFPCSGLLQNRVNQLRGHDLR